jgi:hypothetical protein
METVETVTKTGQIRKANVVYRLPHSVLANELVNRFKGVQPIILIEITDEHGKLIIGEDELKKRGATFATALVERDLSGSMRATHRETGEDNPFKKTKQGAQTHKAIEKYTIQYLLNCIWQNVVDNKRDRVGGVDTAWQANEKRSNGIENYRDSRVVCHKIKDDKETFYFNYIVLRYLTDRIIVDEEGRELDKAYVEGFMSQSKEQKQASRENEAEKHGIAVGFDPQIRQMKLSNISEIRVFGYTFQPTESIATV